MMFRDNPQRRILTDERFLKSCFPLQDENTKKIDAVAENFELELKKFYSMGRRRTGRSSMLARVLVETALESGREIRIQGHYVDARVGDMDKSEMINKCLYFIEEYRQKGCHIEIIKMSHNTFQLFLDKNSISIYNQIKIENNPSQYTTFPTQRIKKRKEFLLKRRLLLL